MDVLPTLIEKGRKHELSCVLRILAVEFILRKCVVGDYTNSRVFRIKKGKCTTSRYGEL